MSDKWVHGTKGISPDHVTSYELRPVGTRVAEEGEIEALCAKICNAVNAAPALLAACEAAEKQIAAENYAYFVEGTTKATRPVMMNQKETLATLRAAIRAAKGESK